MVLNNTLVTFFITFLFFISTRGENQPIVTTPLGQVQGTLRTSFGGRTYAAFEGIPYAKPPVGNLRFEEPQPIEPWTGVWNANFPTQCAQTALLSFPNSSQNMSEDCLHLNVYAPIGVKKNTDVIVNIHGGAYMYGSGHFFTSPHYFMDRDVIFVSLNYRLGILGFLSTEDDVVPGNNGFKDQVMALRWIKDNIASFGGNPDSVTLTGVSAGGGSVHYHYLSELSKGLFHRGISQSGVALNPWGLQKEPLTKAKLLAGAVGCPTSSSLELVNCLKQRPYQHILAQMPLFFGFNDAVPLAPFGPVVEKGTKNKAFLIDQPYKLLVDGKVNDVPWICSFAAHEGYLAPILFSNDTIDFINDQWEDVAPHLLDFNYTVPKSKWGEVARKVKDFYLGPGQKFNMEDNLKKMVAMFGDRLFAADAEDAVRLQSEAVKSPVHLYLFDYPGDQSETEFVPHGADARYLFGDFFTQQPLSGNDLVMSDLMMDMFLTFAKTGKATFKGVNWEPTKSDVLKYLHIKSYKTEENKLEITEELTSRRFWKSLGLAENVNLLRSNKKEEL